MTGKRIIDWWTRPFWARLDGALIFGLGFTMGAWEHRFWSRAALLVAVMLGGAIFSEILRWAAGLPSQDSLRRKQPQ